MIILHELKINLHDGKTMYRSDTLCIIMMLENKTLFWLYVYIQNSVIWTIAISPIGYLLSNL